MKALQEVHRFHGHRVGTPHFGIRPRSTPRADEAASPGSREAPAQSATSPAVIVGVRVRSWLFQIWACPRLAIATAFATIAVWGVAAGRWTPRGPLDTGEALWSMAISAAVGAVAGLLTRSRWAMLMAPVTFAVFFELVRINTDGPTVDGISFTTYGIIAFITGRGFHGLLSLAPMMLFAMFGAGFTRAVDRATDTPSEPSTGPRRPVGRYLRGVVAGFSTVLLIALATVIARPAHTDAIVGPDGTVLAGSVAELTDVRINGHDLGMMIRGHDVDAPVLLYLAGGPGGSELGAMRNHLPELEEHFVVVTWDQRGAGTSYDELDPVSTYTFDSAVDDVVGVTNYLRERFDTDQIYLLGQSWGTILGTVAAREHPELFRAYIGAGQMVDPLETDQIFYADTLAWADRTGRTELADDLMSIGPPPYDRMMDYETALSHEHDVYPYDHTGNSEGEGGFSENILAEEYTLIDKVHALGAFIDTFAVMYPTIQDIDFRTDAPTLAVPAFFVQGAHEATGRAVLADEWIEMLQAPIKGVVTLDTSGHRPLFEQPDEFVDFMVDIVLAQTARPS